MPCGQLISFFMLGNSEGIIVGKQVCHEDIYHMPICNTEHKKYDKIFFLVITREAVSFSCN